MLSRNIRIEEDLVDQLFNSSEKRLARTLLLLARYGKEDKPQGVLPKLSQEMLAEMIGTTRSRVNFFMNKFRKLGFIEYNGGLKINTSLLSVVLHDNPRIDRTCLLLNSAQARGRAMISRMRSKTDSRLQRPGVSRFGGHREESRGLSAI